MQLFVLVILCSLMTACSSKQIRTEDNLPLAKKETVMISIIDTGVDSGQEFNAINWDVENGNSAEQTDFVGHGTAVAGIIQKVIQLANMSSSVYIQSVKATSTSLNEEIFTNKNANLALRHAIDSNPRVINYSAGGSQFDKEEYKLLLEAQANGILVVVSAGNDGININENYFPAANHLSNMIVVGATDFNGNMAKFSNWGNSVDVTAPGVKVYTTLPDHRYGYVSGTSFSAPFVSAVAAVIIAQNPTFTPEQVKSYLIDHKDTNLGIFSVLLAKIKRPTMPPQEESTEGAQDLRKYSMFSFRTFSGQDSN